MSAVEKRCPNFQVGSRHYRRNRRNLRLFKSAAVLKTEGHLRLLKSAAVLPTAGHLRPSVSFVGSRYSSA
jgi:hypothetical protein